VSAGRRRFRPAPVPRLRLALVLGFSLAVLVGLALLVKGGDRLVGGAASTAALLRVPPVVVGAVVIGFGTSIPELMVSGVAAAGGDLDLGIGNVVGSNLANLSLILAVAALLTPMDIDTGVLRREAPLATGAAAVFAVLAWDGLTRAEGGVLLVLLVAALGWIVRDARRAVEPELTEELGEFVREFEADLAEEVDELEEVKGLVEDLFDGGDEPGADRPAGPGGVSAPWLVAVTVLALLATLGGAQLLVWGASGLADEAGISDGFIGLTLVAVGTSLPELATAVIAARREEEELVVGNLLGSNVFNSLAVGGLIGVVGPGALADPEVIRTGIVVMVVVVTLAWAFMASGHRVSRAEAGVLLGAYLAAIPLLAR
jgi:cation:H+ antiporter